MATTAGEPISPELALVCPELRAAAIEALPDRDLDRVFRVEQPPSLPEYRLMTSFEAADQADEWVAPLPVAILAYAASSATRMALEGAAFLAVVVGLLSVVALVHS
jgi:hypothetical protein